MKKIVSIILFLLIICTMFNVKAASNTNVGVYSNLVEQTSDKVVIEYGLLDFVGINEGEVMVITMTLDYDTSVISSVEAQGLTNWKVDLAEETKKLVLETDSSKANSGVVQLTFNINKSATINSSNNKINIKDINITNGEDLDIMDKDYTYEIEVDDNGENENTNKPSNSSNTSNSSSNSQNSMSNTKTNTISGNVDKTIAQNKLPKAGIKNIFVLAIVVIAIATVIFKIKSRKIKY